MKAVAGEGEKSEKMEGQGAGGRIWGAKEQFHALNGNGCYRTYAAAKIQRSVVFNG